MWLPSLGARRAWALRAPSGSVGRIIGALVAATLVVPLVFSEPRLQPPALRRVCDAARGTRAEGRCWLDLSWALRPFGRPSTRWAFGYTLLLARRHGDRALEYEARRWLLWDATHHGRHRDAFEHASACVRLSLEFPDVVSRQKATEHMVTVAGLLQDFDDLARARRVGELAHEGYFALTPALQVPLRGSLAILSGNQYLAERRFELAYQTTRAALESEPPDVDPSEARSARFNHMVACLRTAAKKPERLREARTVLHQALARADGAPLAAMAYHQALFANETNLPAEAETVARQTLEALERDDKDEHDSTFAAALEYELGRAFEAQGRFDVAAEAYGRALARADGLLVASGLGGLKDWLSLTRREPLEALFALQARRGDVLGALDTLERARAADFLNAFAASTREVDPRATALELLEQGDRRFRSLAAVFELLPPQDLSERAPRDAPAKLLARVGRDPVLAYFAARGRAFLVRVAGSPPRPALVPLAAPAEDLRHLADDFAARPGDAATAERLAALLLPEGTLPVRGARLRIVAGDELGLERVPWAALRRDGRYLAQDYTIVSAPSLHALAASRESPTAAGAPLVLGDPRGDLPDARAEAREVAARLGVAARTGSEAAWRALAEARPSVLHVATHARGSLAGDVLVLADGDVSAAEILRARPAARLVVLASCHSGVAGRAGLSGSLAQAFLAAGSEHVLASLRSVEDDLARPFVRDFYAAGGATDPPRALAAVQRRRIAAGGPVEAWASFALFGR